MGKKDIYIKKTEEHVLKLLEGKDIELVDVEFVKELDDYYLRVFIDRPEGISINDCTELSRPMNDILDSEDYIDEAYIFEVCSCGDRPFKKDRDFERNLNTKVEARTYKAIDGAKEFVGILKSFDKENVVLTIDDVDVNFERKNLSLVRKAF